MEKNTVVSAFTLIKLEAFQLSYSYSRFSYTYMAIIDDGRSGYFNVGLADETPGELRLSITATSNSGAVVVLQKKFDFVMANEHYNITIEQTAATSTSFSVTFGDEDVIDVTIPFIN